MVFSRREKEERVKQLYEEGKTVREIAKEVHMSFSDIGAIIKKVTGDNSVTKPPVSTETRALQLFSSGKRPIDVTIELDISPEDAEKFFIHYWRLKQQYDFEVQYKDIKNRLPSFLKVYGAIVREGVTEKEAVNFVRCANEIPQLRNVYESLKKEIVGLENKKGCSLVEIDSLQVEIDSLQEESRKKTEYIRWYEADLNKIYFERAALKKELEELEDLVNHKWKDYARQKIWQRSEFWP